MGSSSQARDETPAPFTGSMESEPLDHQGRTAPFTFKRGHDAFSALDAPSPRTLAHNSDEKPLKTWLEQLQRNKVTDMLGKGGTRKDRRGVLMALLGEGARPSGNGVLPCFQPTYSSLAASA